MIPAIKFQEIWMMPKGCFNGLGVNFALKSLYLRFSLYKINLDFILMYSA